MFSQRVLLPVLAVICVVALIAPECEGLTMVSRKAWGARAPTKRPTRMARTPAIVVIHHGASGSCTTRASCTNIVRSYQNYHINTQKWGDIGYNFVVGEDGSVYEGRGWNVVGAHAINYNSKSIGICVIGTFSGRVPNAAAMRAVQELIQLGVRQKTIAAGYKILGHRQANPGTECPGNQFFQAIKRWRGWSPRP